MARQSIVFLILALAANGLAWVYQLVMARMLEPREFAVVLSIASIVAILLFTGNAFQTAVAVGSADVVNRVGAARVWQFASRAGILGAAPAVAIAVLLLVFGPQFQQTFEIADSWVVPWLALSFLISVLLAAGRGGLQGSLRFGTLGAVMMAESGLRLVVSATLVALGFGVAGATAGYAAGFAAALALTVWWLRPRGGSSASDSLALWPFLQPQLPATLAAFGIFGVQATDVVIANARMSAVALESYAAAALAGRITFYAGFVLSLLALPRFRDMFTSGRLDRRLLSAAFGALAVVLVGVLAVGFIQPDLLHTLLVGDRYASDAGLMQTYLLGTSLLTAALLVTHLLIAAGWHRVWLALLPIATAQTLAYALRDPTPQSFAGILLVGSAAMAVVSGTTGATLLWRTARAQTSIAVTAQAEPMSGSAIRRATDRRS